MKSMPAWILALMWIICGMSGALGEESHIWQKGDSGEEVRWIQERLIALEYMTGEADGAYDEATETAVLWFQGGGTE